jgi:putative redox protein
MKAIVQSAAKVGSRVRLGGHDLLFDQPGTVPGGEDRGPSPFDVLIASVAACAHYFAAAYLYARGLPTAGLVVEVEADKQQLPAPRIGRLALKVRVPFKLRPEQLAGIERAIRRCPAYGTLLHPPAIEIAIDEGSEPADERRSA